MGDEMGNRRGIFWDTPATGEACPPPRTRTPPLRAEFIGDASIELTPDALPWFIGLRELFPDAGINKVGNAAAALALWWIVAESNNEQGCVPADVESDRQMLLWRQTFMENLARVERALDALDPGTRIDDVLASMPLIDKRTGNVTIGYWREEGR